MDYQDIYNNIKKLFTNFEGQFTHNGYTIAFFNGNELAAYSYGICIYKNKEMVAVKTLEMLVDGWSDIMEKNCIQLFTDFVLDFTK